MKIKHILTSKNIDSFVNMESIELCVSFIGLDESGCSTELVRSDFYIIKSSDGKYNVVRNTYFDQYIDAIKTLHVTEIEVYTKIKGSLNSEYVKTTLDKYPHKYKKEDIDTICFVFENKIKEIFSKITDNNLSVKIQRRRGMFRNLYSKIEFEASLHYCKKIKKFL